MSLTSSATPSYGPQFPPGARPGIAILGCGDIAQNAHLPAYRDHDLDVVGVWSRTPSRTADFRERFGFVRKVYTSPDELLADPEVGIVDIATPPQARLRWMEAAIAAGKHVLAQKPITTDVAALKPVLAEADRRGLRVAVLRHGQLQRPQHGLHGGAQRCGGLLEHVAHC